MVQFTLAILFFIIAYGEAEKVTVVTSKGAIQGQTNDGYNTFLGVPYAEVNENNPFGSTLEYPNFETPFNANDSSIICPQVYFNDNGTIQCLRLNMYVPHAAKTSQPVPVFVWFHGGGFAFGSGGEYGGQYLVKQNIIVITVNYRLGPYGFLCLNDSSVPGNQGMKDQIMSLRWIKKNILAFGGDANKITIAGESYGGGGVDIHLYSNYEKLFDKIVVESGSMFVTEGIFIKPDYDAAIKLAKYLGHDVSTNKEALKVLAKENPIAVNAATRNMSMFLTLCKEKKFHGVENFVTADPFHLNNPKRVKDTLIMIGSTSQEMLYEFANKPESFYNTTENVIYQQLAKNFVLPKPELEKLSNIVKNFYLGGKTIGPDAQLELSNFLSDFAINYGAEMSVDKYIKQGAKVFKYLFSYTGASDYKNITGAGASHTEELKYLFDWVWASPLVGDEQLMMRGRMSTMWANFAKYGDPTPQKTNLLPVKWIPITDSNSCSRPYLDIDVNMEMKNRVFHERMAFWELFWHVYRKKYVLLN